MKYAIVLPDGAADQPLPELDGRTPLEVACIPHIDRVAQRGRLGRVRTVPDGFIPGTDVATLVLLGYDPRRFYPGRASIEAAARGLELGPDELVFRCNFVTIEAGRMRDFTAGHITQAEADRLIADLNALVAAGDPPLSGCQFYSGVSYRNLTVMADAADLEVVCAPPHDIPNEPIAAHRPRGRGAERVEAVMDRARELLREHAVNRRRGERGKPPVTDIWLWGQGRAARLEPLAERFGLRGAVITGVALVRGLAVLSGMDLIEVPGATGYVDTDYAGKGRAAVQALERYDLVIVHVEAPDEAGHLGDARLKVETLERIDELIVGPLLEALRRHESWRMLIAPDHPTPCATTAHDATPPPFCYAGSDVAGGSWPGFSEHWARAAPLVDPGEALLAEFLGRQPRATV